MQWLKEHWGLIAITVLTVVAIGGVIWFHATHTCIAWEDKPTGEKCVDWRLETYTTLGMNGKMETKTRRVCTKHVPCRLCTKWVRDEEVGEKPIKPKDRC